MSLDLNALIEQALRFASTLKDHLGHLVSMPALARQRLDEVLGKIDGTFVAVDGVVEEHLKVSLDPSLIEADKNLMLRLSGPDLPLRIKRDRAHCHAIWDVYVNHLRGLLDPLFATPQARDEVETIFRELGRGDQDLFELFEIAGKALQGRATQALKLQLVDDVDGAKALLKGDAATLIDMRQRLQDAHLTLVQIRNGFIKGMKAPP